MDETDERATEEIRRACRVIARGGIVSISVVTGRRLTEEHLRQARTYATARGVHLASDGAGTVTLRAGLRTPAKDHRIARLWPAWRRSGSRLAGSDAR
jgi:hypothetical protein